ncbi:MAG TPA: hypothetical protein PLP19_04640 [bacterium]|nr:hypothetical protein [bacterium]HPN42758.1 hypothetical protein [bacterium]
MKKVIIYSIILVSLWFMTIGMNCETRQIEIPVLGTENHLFEVEETISTYNDQFMMDFTDEINRIKADNSFDSIAVILLQNITYTIQDNQSAAGTIINGSIDVSSTSYNAMTPIIAMTNIDLDSVENVEITPELEQGGVNIINVELSPIISGTDNTLYFSVHGTATPAPSAAKPLKFKVLVKVYINVIGIVKVDVPVM